MKKLLVLLMFVPLLFITCKKDKEEPVDGLQTMLDNKLVQENFITFESAIDAEKEDKDGDWSKKKGGNGPIKGKIKCVYITYDTVNHIKTLHFGLDTATMTYSNCKCDDNKERRGMIHLSFQGKYVDQGSITTGELEDFYVEDHSVTGKMTITRKPNNNNGHPERELKVENASVTAANNSWKVSWHRLQTVEVIKGDTTLDPFDNIYKIIETGGGVSKAGVTFSYETTTPLFVRFWFIFPSIVEGVIELKVAGSVVATLDFDPIGTYDPTGETQPFDYKFCITTADGVVHKFGY